MQKRSGRFKFYDCRFTDGTVQIRSNFVERKGRRETVEEWHQKGVKQKKEERKLSSSFYATFFSSGTILHFSRVWSLHIYTYFSCIFNNSTLSVSPLTFSSRVHLDIAAIMVSLLTRILRIGNRKVRISRLRSKLHDDKPDCIYRSHLQRILNRSSRCVALRRIASHRVAYTMRRRKKGETVTAAKIARRPIQLY